LLFKTPKVKKPNVRSMRVGLLKVAGSSRPGGSQF
jgi:hypothetical protein